MERTLQNYIEACSYPGFIDETAVEAALRQYLNVLGINRHVVRLRRGWMLNENSDLHNYIHSVLDNIRNRISAQDALSVQNALDALEARDVLAALSALSAKDARAALSAQDALNARDALAALDALEARVSLSALAALSVQDAREARDAQDALEARAARAAQEARDAQDALEARAAQDALDALEARVSLSARAALSAQDALNALNARDALAAQDVLDALEARVSLSALAAQDARAEKALFFHRLACWCISRQYWWCWDLSWLSTTYFGATELKKSKEIKWSGPVLDAFLNGCWFLYWTKKTLYWVAKPTLHFDANRRLHSETGSAVESDLEDLYFFRGVLVPSEWIKHKNQLTPETALTWPNAEQRRAACEIIGWQNVLEHPSLNPKVIDTDEPYIGTLIQVDLPDAPGQWFLKYRCATGRWFAEAVNDKTFDTALKANAGGNGWRPGLGDPESYIPFVRT